MPGLVLAIINNESTCASTLNKGTTDNRVARSASRVIGIRLNVLGYVFLVNTKKEKIEKSVFMIGIQKTLNIQRQLSG